MRGADFFVSPLYYRLVATLTFDRKFEVWHEKANHPSLGISVCSFEPTELKAFCTEGLEEPLNLLESSNHLPTKTF